jgi:uncharacterized membrane protein
MNRLNTATLATAFAAASSLALLAVPGTALADKGDHGNKHGGYHTSERGDKNCTNPAGNTRGWCKHAGDKDDRKRNHRTSGASTISGTVLGVSGNIVSFRLDNGQVVSLVDNNGTQLNAGQHYRLRGAYQNGQFVLGATNGGNYSGNGGNHNATSVSGNIVAVGTGTITLLGVPPLVINVQQALNNNATNGSLSVGRHVTAYGYYSNNVFYATSIQ